MIAIVLASSCSKYEDLPIVEKDPIILSKKQFQRDSIAFVRSGEKPNYNFRQSLEREIDWGRSYLSNNKVIAPITLRLPDGMVTERGKTTLDHGVWLVIQRDSLTQQYSYTMITLIADEETEAQGFSGTALFEDYFQATVQHALYEKGNILPKPQSRTTNSASTKKMAMYSNCGWVKIATICVGDVAGNGSPDICGDRYEYRCERVDARKVHDVDELAGGGGGGSSGSSNNSSSEWNSDMSSLWPGDISCATFKFAKPSGNNNRWATRLTHIKPITFTEVGRKTYSFNIRNLIIDIPAKYFDNTSISAKDAANKSAKAMNAAVMMLGELY